jgi:integrase
MRKLRTGGIKKLPSGRFQIDFRDQDGIRHRESFDREREARAALDATRTQVRKREYIAPADVPTFQEVALAWFEEKKVSKARGSSPKIKKATLDKWDNHLRKHLNPIYGARKMDTIQTAEIEASRGVWRQAGLCPKSVNELLTTMAAIFNEAMRQDKIRMNPAARAHRLATGSNVADEAGNASAEVSEDQIYDREEILRLIDGAEPGLYQTLFMTLAFIGLRHGEAAALRWEDIDLDARIVKVNQNWANIYDQNGNPTFTTPKTRSSRRTIPNISSSLALELRKWKLRCPRANGISCFQKQTARHWIEKQRGGRSMPLSRTSIEKPETATNCAG